MNRPMELDIWAGDWGLPSVDLQCLEVMAYAKFSGVPLQTRVTSSPFWTPNGTLPVFRHGKKVLCGLSSISDYLRQKNYSADFGLSPKQCAEVVAYTQLLKAQLHLALQYVWWVDTKNYLELVRPWYAKQLPFPFNYYYPGRYRREAQDKLQALYEHIEDPLQQESCVFGEAEKCLTALSVRLGDQDFFFGSHPTSLDAIVYAYLAPLLKVPFPSAALQNYLKACTNLVKFVVRISQRYFPQAIQEYESRKASEEAAKRKQTDLESDFPNRRRNQFLAGLFATVAMTAYALTTGIVQIPDDWLQDKARRSRSLKNLLRRLENMERDSKR